MYNSMSCSIPLLTSGRQEKPEIEPTLTHNPLLLLQSRQKRSALTTVYYFISTSFQH